MYILFKKHVHMPGTTLRLRVEEGTRYMTDFII